LDYVDLLNELDTSSVQAMAQVADRHSVDVSDQRSDRFAYAIREDIKEELRKSLPQDVALQNAPESDGSFFKVPKVIDR
jgi:aspartyl-tRNA(Asn)/glutamyl-tRNA(Gln) amidotransferase subunit C